MKFYVGNRVILCKLKNVFHIPSFHYSLLSVSEHEKKGCVVTFHSGKCKISKEGNIFSIGILNGSYTVNTNDVQKEMANVVSLSRWRERLCHVETRGFVNMFKKGCLVV